VVEENACCSHPEVQQLFAMLQMLPVIVVSVVVAAVVELCLVAHTPRGIQWQRFRVVINSSSESPQGVAQLACNIVAHTIHRCMCVCMCVRLSLCVDCA